MLEVGCDRSPDAHSGQKQPRANITSVDISADSLRRADDMIRKECLTNVTFCQGDIFHLPFLPDTFDHIFVCFVLEHLAYPQRALEQPARS